jgi:lipoprotein NlpD
MTGRICRSQAALVMIAACVLTLYGCTTAPVPVSERDVSDYRKPQPSASPSIRSPSQAAAPTAASVESRPGPTKPAAAAAPPKPPAAGASGAPEAGEEGDWRPETYTIKRSDTLYSIALDHGLDYKELAAWNQLPDANVIKVGQLLKLRPPPGWKPESVDATDEVIARPLAQTPLSEPQPLEAPAAPKTSPKGIKVPYSEAAMMQLTQDPTSVPGFESKPLPPEPKPQNRTQVALEQKPAEPKPIVLPEPVAKPAPAIKVEPMVAKPAIRPEATGSDQPSQWSWPASGKLVHGFNQGSNPKGVAIRGAPGQSIFATAGGKVVYSGSGLRGYGKLIILKHSNTYLSVYAHNRELLVKEGERVSRGQKIAEMGSDSADGVALHFEIRRLGKPVDPLKFLPAEGT